MIGTISLRTLTIRDRAEPRYSPIVPAFGISQRNGVQMDENQKDFSKGTIADATLTPEEWEHLRPADFSFSNEIDKMNSRLKALELELHEKIRQNKLLRKIIEKCLTQN